jgi:hypothetical protein
VAQPPGFTTGRGILIERIDLAASWRNLLADPAAVRSIDLQSPEITLEVGTGGTSVGKLIENLRSRRGTSRRLHVDTVRVVKPRLRLAQSLLVKIERTIDVPGFELTDVSAGGDVTLADLLLKVLARMLTQAGLPPEVAAVLGKDEAVRALQDPIEGVKRLLDDALRPK